MLIFIDFHLINVHCTVWRLCFLKRPSRPICCPFLFTTSNSQYRNCVFYVLTRIFCNRFWSSRSFYSWENITYNRMVKLFENLLLKVWEVIRILVYLAQVALLFVFTHLQSNKLSNNLPQIIFHKCTASSWRRNVLLECICFDTLLNWVCFCL